MAETSTIEWTDATWNPITGCTIVSAGCTNCYAMHLAAGRLQKHPSREGLTRISGGRPVWTGKVRLNEQWLDQPLRWTRPRMIFVCAHGDLFHEAVPDDWIDRVFAVMALAPQHTFQVLTKRPERARGYLSSLHAMRITEGRVERMAEKLAEARDWDGDAAATVVFEAIHAGLRNVWLGTSVEDQATADTRIPHLLATPAAVRFVSVEPLLGPVVLDLKPSHRHRRDCAYVVSNGPAPCTCSAIHNGLDWVIVGGESGKRARPMHPDWARSLRDQCQAAGVAFFFKQWGEWAPRYVPGAAETDPPLDTTPRAMWHDAVGLITDTLEARDPMEFWCEGQVFRVGKARAGRLLDGREWSQMPGVSK